MACTRAQQPATAFSLATTWRAFALDLCVDKFYQILILLDLLGFPLATLGRLLLAEPHSRNAMLGELLAIQVELKLLQTYTRHCISSRQSRWTLYLATVECRSTMASYLNVLVCGGQLTFTQVHRSIIHFLLGMTAGAPSRQRHAQWHAKLGVLKTGG